MTDDSWCVAKRKGASSTWVEFLPWFHRYYILFIVGMAGLMGWANFHARHGFHTIDKHLAFKNIIVKGFDPVAAGYPTPTFPMWGYGWLLLITESKVALIVLQYALAIVSIWLLLRYIAEQKILGGLELFLLEFVMIISVPWYAFHSFPYPPSIASSLLILSILFLAKGFFYERAVNWAVVASGLFLGTALNFRSDFFLFPVGLVGITWLLFPTKKSLKSLLGWIAMVYLALLPWGIYAKHVTGHFLFSSTNGGHVLFIGLGQLPDNRWGITYSDKDPRMFDVVRWEVGEDAAQTNYGTTLYESDVALKREFWRLVAEDPSEYWRKLKWAFQTYWDLHEAEFYEVEKEPFKGGYERQRAWHERLAGLGHWRILKQEGPSILLRVLLERISVVIREIFQRHGVPLYAFLIFPFVAIVGALRRDVLVVGAMSVLAYRCSLSIVSVTQPQYTTQVYVFHVLSIVLFVHYMRGYATQWAAWLRAAGGAVSR